MVRPRKGTISLAAGYFVLSLRTIAFSSVFSNFPFRSIVTSTPHLSVISDITQIALLITIIRQTNSTVKWSTLRLPKGRNITSCKNTYQGMIRDCAGVEMEDGEAAATPAHNRRKANDSEGTGGDASGKGKRAKEVKDGKSKKRSLMDAGKDEGGGCDGVVQEGETKRPKRDKEVTPIKDEGNGEAHDEVW